MASTTTNHNIQEKNRFSKSLTPDIVVVAALLYMMSSDGNLSHEEISILQQSIGEDDQVIQRARSYIKNNKVDTFISESIQFLDKASKLFVLLNVYDCMYSDGMVEKGESKLFLKILIGFGFTEKFFKPFAEIIEFKNNKSSLGEFNPQDLIHEKQTPHKVLGSLLIYMMSSDGAISSQEIGQISSILGKYQGLQEFCAAQVTKIKFENYLDSATTSLNEIQKLYIATNFCDSMMADGSAADEEMSLLTAVLTKFNISEITFKPYFDLIKNKNTNPLHALIANEKNAGNIFINRSNKEDELGQSNVIDENSAEKIIFNNVINDDQDGQLIKRTMEENIEKAKDSLKNSENIVAIQHNTESNESKGIIFDNEIQDLDSRNEKPTNSKPNIAKITSKKTNENIQELHNSSTKDKSKTAETNIDNSNSISIENSTEDKNIQLLGSKNSLNNQQHIVPEVIEKNIQSIQNQESISNKISIKSNEISSSIISTAPESFADHSETNSSLKIEVNTQSTSLKINSDINISNSKEDLNSDEIRDRNVPFTSNPYETTALIVDRNKASDSTATKNAELIQSINKITSKENSNRLSKINDDLEDVHGKLRLLEKNSPLITIDNVVITKKQYKGSKNNFSSKEFQQQKISEKSNIISDELDNEIKDISNKKSSKELGKIDENTNELDFHNNQVVEKIYSPSNNTMNLQDDRYISKTSNNETLTLSVAKESLALAKKEKQLTIKNNSQSRMKTQIDDYSLAEFGKINLESRTINSSHDHAGELTSIATLELHNSIPSITNSKRNLRSIENPTLAFIAMRRNLRHQILNTFKLTVVAAIFTFASGFSDIGCDLVQCSWKQLEAPLSVEFQDYIIKTQDVLLTLLA
jgi:uncharacterized tellurite resistance protein B-like protein